MKLNWMDLLFFKPMMLNMVAFIAIISAVSCNYYLSAFIYAVSLFIANFVLIAIYRKVYPIRQIYKNVRSIPIENLADKLALYLTPAFECSIASGGRLSGVVRYGRGGSFYSAFKVVVKDDIATVDVVCNSPFPEEWYRYLKTKTEVENALLSSGYTKSA